VATGDGRTRGAKAQEATPVESQAISLAHFLARNHQRAGGDPMLVAMPADHIISGVEAFRAAVTHGALHAESSINRKYR